MSIINKPSLLGPFPQSSLVFFLVLMVAGCSNNSDNNTDSNAPSATTSTETNSSTVNEEQRLKGYKEWEFGMTTSQLAQVEGCKQSYIKFAKLDTLPAQIGVASAKFIDNANEPEISQLNKKIEELLPQITELETQQATTTSTYEKYRIENLLTDKRRTLENSKLNVQTLVTEANEIRQHPDEVYQREVQPLLDNLILGRDYDQIITDEWFNSKAVYCTTSIMGSAKQVSLTVTDGKLSGITIVIGQFDDETYQSLRKGLAVKYSSSYTPPDNQVSAFNQFKIPRIATTFMNGQVVLSVENRYGGMRTTKMLYLDRSSADEYAKTVTQGLVLPGDL